MSTLQTQVTRREAGIYGIKFTVYYHKSNMTIAEICDSNREHTPPKRMNMTVEVIHNGKTIMTIINVMGFSWEIIRARNKMQECLKTVECQKLVNDPQGLFKELMFCT